MKRTQGTDPSLGDDNSSFEWEFETDVPAGEAAAWNAQARLRPNLPPRPPTGRPADRDSTQDGAAASGPDEEQTLPREHVRSPLAAKYAGAEGERRARTVLHLLESALERWWRLGELPPRTFVREGLLVLEAGHALSEALLSLLLRSALYYGMGQLTALHYQTDMERVAILVREAALLWDPPLSAATVAWLAEQDPWGSRWTRVLIDELRLAMATEGPEARRRAGAVLFALEGMGSDGLSIAREPGPMEAGSTGWGGRTRWWLALALVVVVAGLVWWQAAVRLPADMIAVPSGVYQVSDPAGVSTTRYVTLNSFLIDRTEVTNRAYRRCVERGACPWPRSNDSATRTNYFLDPAFNDFPVVNLTWDAAGAFCRWVDKRLPTAEEWEVAAGYAPATNRQFRYPWGEQFDTQRANSALSGPADTVAVSHYRPAGDSMLGASGMAGNVAEWTSSRVQAEGGVGLVVKGGSFADAPEALVVSAQTVLDGQSALPWVGVRCARTLLLDQQ